jgi:hypothetical protein
MPHVEADGVLRSLDWLADNAATVTRVRVWGGDLVELPPVLPAVLEFRCGISPKLKVFPSLPAAKIVRIWGCEGITEIPELPCADQHVDVWGCPNFILQTAGFSPRDDRSVMYGNRFFMFKGRGAWRVNVGAKGSFTVAELRLRWGKGTNPKNPRGQPAALAMVEELVEKLAKLHPDEIKNLDIVERADGELYGQREMPAAESIVRCINVFRVLRGELPFPTRAEN